MVKDFVFTEQSFEADLLKTATILLQNSTDNRYVIALLLYAIHLDISIQTTVVGIKEMC